MTLPQPSAADFEREPRAELPWHFGATAETYGVGVWVARIENLRAHFRIIADYLPDDLEWLANQVRSAIAEADRYIADCVPESGQ